MELVATASLLTALIAGFAALLAPCCVGVMLPAYLASVFKKRTQIFLMTFVYFLGILSIYLPLGLGIASLSSFFSANHVVIFSLGAIFMILLGLFLITGRSLMLPIKVHPRIKQHNLGSIYLLGIFSGIATTCCAPVLAGVLALSALPGSVWLGGIYALVFVIGMVLPLFIMAMLFDRGRIVERIKLLRRRVSYSVMGRQVSVNLSHLLSGVLYIIFGLFILIFERANPEALGSGYQLQINLWAARITRTLSRLTNGIPEFIWILIALLVVFWFSRIAYIQFKHSDHKKEIKDV